MRGDFPTNPKFASWQEINTIPALSNGCKMDALKSKIAHHEKAVLDLLNACKTGYQEYVWGNREDIIVADKNSRHYQLVVTGWRRGGHLHNLLMHFHIRPDGKIWIEVNNTEVEVARELLERGVPKTDIVLAFHPENVRPLTGFAVA